MSSLLQRDAEFEAEYYAARNPPTAAAQESETAIRWDDDEEGPRRPMHHRQMQEHHEYERRHQQHDKRGKCANWGCKRPSKGECNCCRRVGYCSRKCQVAHYGEHVEVDGCVTLAQAAPGAVHWAVEAEVGQSNGEREEAWEGLNLVHARVDAEGRVLSWVHNQDLVAGTASKEPFHAKEVPPGDLRTNQVSGGRARRDHGIETRVYISLTAHDHGEDIQFQTLDGTKSIDLPTHDVVSLSNDGGTTIQMKHGELHRALGSDRKVAPQGAVVVGLEIGTQRWMLWGSYDLMEAEQSGAAGVVQDVRKGAINLTRRALGHRHRVVRIRGEDQNGVRASLTFRRHSSEEYGVDASYQLESLRIHVPKGGGRDNHPWYTASQTMEAFRGPDTFARGKDRSQLEQTLLKTWSEDLTNLPADLMDAAGKTLETTAETVVEFEPTNAENRIHVAALVTWLADHQQSLSNGFVGAQMHVPPEQAKRMHAQLNNVARMRSLLDKHAKTLAAEEAGTQVPEDIAPEVITAIVHTEELIGANDLRKWASRKGEVARARKLAKTMSEDQAVAAFVSALESAEAEQAFGSVGSQWIATAKIYRERVRQLGATKRIQEYGDRFQTIEAQEKARRKGKHQRSKQKAGTAEAEEMERERTGK